MIIHVINAKWRTTRQNEILLRKTETRIVRYEILQVPKYFSELPHSSFEASEFPVRKLVYTFKGV